MGIPHLIPLGLSWGHSKTRDWNYLKTVSHFWHLKLAHGQLTAPWLVLFTGRYMCGLSLWLGFPPLALSPRRERAGQKPYCLLWSSLKNHTATHLLHRISHTQGQLWLTIRGNLTGTYCQEVCESLRAILEADLPQSKCNPEKFIDFENIVLKQSKRQKELYSKIFL